VLILLPPSEGKASPVRGKPLDLEALSFPALTPTRTRVLDALVSLCRDQPEQARSALGLSLGQGVDIARNAHLASAPTASAGRIYCGVLYEALDLAHADTVVRRRATSRVAVASALFGLVRLGDRIPAYRLGGASSLPGLGSLASIWREPLGVEIDRQREKGLVVDLRSGTYAAFARPAAAAHRHVSVRVLHEVDGVRSVVSHFNKATKGRLVADLLADGATPGTPAALQATLTRLGWTVERALDPRPTLDVIVTTLH
jgi:cytoplasmic iron level regulating protein YaaA (DUF328/UPF0246 family)